jgi:glutamine amidotransferase
MLAVDPELFDVQGSTDTEVVFRLALTFGLMDDPIGALERTVGLIESVAARHDVPDAVQATFGVTDGETLWAVRYATQGPARSLFASCDADTVRRLYPDNPRLQRVRAGDRLIVSEPFADLPGVWQEIPAGSAVTVRRDAELEHQPFRPAPVDADGLPRERRPRLLTSTDTTVTR